MRTLRTFIALSALGIALTTIPTTPAKADTPDPGYSFQGIEQPRPGGKMMGVVQIVDNKDPEDGTEAILQVIAPAGGQTVGQRAQEIAKQLTKYYSSDSKSLETLQLVTVNSQIVIAPAGVTNDWIVTADDNSRKAKNAPTRQVFAAYVRQDLTQALHGVLYRDAKFDYQLTQDEKNDRARTYCENAQEAYATKDLDVAESKYALALKLSPDYTFCRIQLANLYTEMKRFSEAKALYQQVLASNPDAQDKQEVSDGLTKIGG